MQVHTDWLLTPERAAIHLPTSTAVIADLHIGYNTIRCCNGEALPTFDLDEVIAVLESLMCHQGLQRLVIAGDLYEDDGTDLPAGELWEWLWMNEVELVGVVPGNHDRNILNSTCDLPVCPNGILLGDWQVVHGDGPLPQGRVVQGHVHPCFRWDKDITAPCYLVAPNQIILPAFSEDAAGVNVLRGPTWRNYRCYVIADEKVLDFGDVATLQQRKGNKERRKS
jgi:putative SbcD/Mre11-related phosphoesterase